MILKIYSGENHISHGIYESAYFYRGFPGFPGIEDDMGIFSPYHKSIILAPVGWRDTDDGRVENAEFAYLRSRSENRNGNMLTAKLHPDRSDVDKN